MTLVKKAPPLRVARQAAVPFVLGFCVLFATSAHAATISLPGWSVLRITIPQGGELREASVELKTGSSEKLTLEPHIRSYAGITLEQVEWFGEPRRARVTLRKGDDRAELLAEAATVVTAETPAPRKPQIEIEARFVEVTADAAKNLPLLGGADGPIAPGKQALPNGLIAVIDEPNFQAQVATMVQRRGVDLLTTPRVTTKSGQPAEIQVFHEFRYPTDWEPAAAPKKGWVAKTFGKKSLGTTLKLEAVVAEDETIDLQLDPRMDELLGFVDFVTKKPLVKLNRERLFERTSAPEDESPKTRREPVFSARQATIACTIKSGQTVVFVLPPGEVPTGFTAPNNGRVLLGLVSARRVTAQLAPPEEAVDPPPAPAAPLGGPAVDARPVVGKPGFVTSPHAPDAGYIDVRGFAPGTELKDPYSGKLIRVPAAE